jgi:hypothetical protein
VSRAIWHGLGDGMQRLGELGLRKNDFHDEKSKELEVINIKKNLDIVLIGMDHPCRNRNNNQQKT